MAVPTRQARRKLAVQRRQVEAQPQQVTPSDVFLAFSRPSATQAMLGRMRPHFAPQTGYAYGNSGISSDARASAPAAQPGKGGQASYTSGNNIGDASPYPGPGRPVRTPPSMLNLRAYTPQFQHGRGIARDRHIIGNRGMTQSSDRQQATGGSPNPEKDGPARPAWLMFNRTLSWQIGTDSTRNLDGGQFHAKVMAGEETFPLGTQGDRWSIVYGGTPGLTQYRRYGERGSSFAGAPQPTVYAAPGGPQKFGTLVQQGDAADGPQKVYPGLPWGLHTSTVPSRTVTASTLQSRFNQVRPVQQNRPLNNKSAGQSYNQQVVTLTGHQPVRIGTLHGGRQPGLNARYLGNG